MGTRSHVTFIDEGGRLLTTVYAQYDGYLSGRGQELAKFLEGIKIVNGFGTEDKPGEVANGMSCLAAQWIAHEKKSVGGVYIEPPTDGIPEDSWVEYVYDVKWDGKGSVTITARDRVNLVFQGTPTEFLAMVNQPSDDS